MVLQMVSSWNVVSVFQRWRFEVPPEARVESILDHASVLEY